MPYDVFVSYATPDKTVADAACAILESKGIRCWIAPRDILPGSDWSGAIIDALAECRALLLILSSKSNTSEQVKREVAQAVNDSRPIIPFRIEEVPLSKHMRYFIGTPHWMDALTEPLEHHLHALADNIHRLLGLQESAAPMPLKSGEIAAAVAQGKRLWGSPGQRRLQPGHALSLRIAGPESVRNVCLLAKGEVTLGKQRDSDIVLRVMPPSLENDQRSEQISRHHATIVLSREGATWTNLNCANGTAVGSRWLDARQSAELRDGDVVRPAGVVSLVCDVYPETRIDGSSYQAVLNEAGLPAATSGKRFPALRLRRTDSLAGLEQHVMFSQAVALGRNPHCPILIPDTKIDDDEALLLWLGGVFWIEATRKESALRHEGKLVPQGALFPLQPGVKFEVGGTRVEAAEYGHYYLDFSMPQ